MLNLLSRRRLLTKGQTREFLIFQRNLTTRYSLELIEDLHPHKRVEHKRLQLILLVRRVVRQDLRPRKVQDERDGQLIDRLPDDHLPHGDRDQRCRLAIRLTIQDAWRRRIRR